jgi:predicted nucleic acid-binding protein
LRQHADFSKEISHSQKISFANTKKNSKVNEPIVLDSFALVAFYHKEGGWQKVQKTLYDLAASGQKALLSVINWGEFYYTIKRRVGKRKAEGALALLAQLPVEILPADIDLVKEAAEIKSDYPVSYADAFCIATAQRFQGRVFTNDPEFTSVADIVPVVWLVPPG